MTCETSKTSETIKLNSFEFWKEQCGYTTEAYSKSEQRLQAAYNLFVKEHTDIYGVALASACCATFVKLGMTIGVSLKAIENCLNSMIYRNKYNCEMPVKRVAEITYKMLNDIYR